jgi:hypothetical protein
LAGCATTASAIAQQRDNQRSNDHVIGRNVGVYRPLRRRRMKRGDHMELHFMVLAILLLTLIASCAIRQAEEETIERRDLDARKPPPTQPNRDVADEHEQGDVVGYLRPR